MSVPSETAKASSVTYTDQDPDITPQDEIFDTHSSRTVTEVSQADLVPPVPHNPHTNLGGRIDNLL